MINKESLKKKKKWLIVFGIILVSGISFFIYRNNVKNDEANQEIKTEKVVRGDINVVVTGSGQIYATNQVDLKPQVAGDGLDIASIHIENNQEVKKNDLIAVLDTTDAQEKVRDAQLNLESAEIQYDAIKDDYDDDKADSDDKKKQKIAIQQKENALADAQKDLSDYYIRAPFDGIVTGLDVAAGDSISRTETLASVITKELQAEISLNEVDAAKVKVGNKVNLTFDALGETITEGEVSKVDTIGRVESGVVTYDVEISFDSNKIEYLKSGMSVGAEIKIESAENVLIISSSVVKERKDGKKIVAIFSGDDGEQKGEMREVEVGISDDIYTEIRSGLEEGEIIILGGSVSKRPSDDSDNNKANSVLPTMGGGGMRGMR